MSEAAWTQLTGAWPQAVVFAGSLTAFVWAAAGMIRQRARGESPIPWRPHAVVPWEGQDVAIVAGCYVTLAATLQHFAVAPRTAVNRLVDNVFLSLAATLAAVAWLRLRGADRTSLGLGPQRWGEAIGLAVRGLALCVFPLLALAMTLNTIVPYEHPVVDFVSGARGPAAALLVILSAVVVAPIAEELFFRRILQGWLEKQFDGDRGVAVGVAALAFAAAHAGQGLAFIPLFLLGCLLGVIAERTGSIAACILLHGLFNAVSVFVMLAQPRVPV